MYPKLNLSDEMNTDLNNLISKEKCYQKLLDVIKSIYLNYKYRLNICILLKTKLSKLIDVCEKKGITNLVISTHRLFVFPSTEYKSSATADVNIDIKDQDSENYDLNMP